MNTKLFYKANNAEAFAYAQNLKNMYPHIEIVSMEMADLVQLVLPNNIVYQGIDSVNALFPTQESGTVSPVNVFINFHVTPIPDRNREIHAAIQKVIDDDIVTKLYILRESGDTHDFKSDKIVDHVINERPTYRTIIDFVNSVTQPNDVNVIMNSDCFFNPNFIRVVWNIKSNECYSLNRMEINDVNDMTTAWRMVGTTDSQDGWAFRGKINIDGGNFYLGIPGCDNTICYQIHKSGYILINPLGSDIFLYHYHRNQYRSYDAGSDRLPHPYAVVSESTLNTPSAVGILQ